MFQRGYDIVWDACAMPVGTFRMLVALVPVLVDAGLASWSGGLPSVTLGIGLHAVTLCLLYDPFIMARENRLQMRGAYTSLNSASHMFARSNQGRRLFYIATLIVTVTVFHRVGGFLLVDIAYARGVKIRPRQRRDRWTGSASLEGANAAPG